MSAVAQVLGGSESAWTTTFLSGRPFLMATRLVSRIAGTESRGGVRRCSSHLVCGGMRSRLKKEARVVLSWDEEPARATGISTRAATCELGKRGGCRAILVSFHREREGPRPPFCFPQPECSIGISPLGGMAGTTLSMCGQYNILVESPYREPAFAIFADLRVRCSPHLHH